MTDKPIERTAEDDNYKWLTKLAEAIWTHGVISPETAGRVYAVRDQLRAAVNSYAALVEACEAKDAALEKLRLACQPFVEPAMEMLRLEPGLQPTDNTSVENLFYEAEQPTFSDIKQLMAALAQVQTGIAVEAWGGI